MLHPTVIPSFLPLGSDLHHGLVVLPVSLASSRFPFTEVFLLIKSLHTQSHLGVCILEDSV